MKNRHRSCFMLAATVVLGACATLPQPEPDESAGPHYDARTLVSVEPASPSAAQRRAEDQLRSRVADAYVRHDSRFGVVQSAYSLTEPLSPATSGTPEEIAERWIVQQREFLGLTPQDLDERQLTDVVPDVTGATHLYWQQRHMGIDAYNAILAISVEADGSIQSINNSFAPNIAGTAGTASPSLSAADAVAESMRHLSLPPVSSVVISGPSGDAQRTEIEHPLIPGEVIVARLVWLPFSQNDNRLAWNFQWLMPDYGNKFDFTVDAESGEILTRFDWVAHANYRVYPQPTESPNDATPAPPADARTTLTDPHDTGSSPFGWHDTNGVAGAEDNRLRGNNVAVYLDRDNVNPSVPPPGGADCGAALNCDFALNLADTTGNAGAAATNVFYWTNHFHDVLANHGFDAASGNFQANNYGATGVPGDAILAELQNGYGTGTELNCRNPLTRMDVACRGNASFTTEPDGVPGRMQIEMSDDSSSPIRDGGFDNGVVVHELAHGVTSRLAGAPSRASCTMSPESISEGVSDYMALAFTQRPGDTPGTPRSIGTWMRGEAATGAGVRRFPYTLDPNLNGRHHEQLYDCVTVHCIGEVWAQGLWGAHWTMIEDHGFAPDLAAGAGSGNQRMLDYLVSGLKRTRCGADPVAARDGLLLGTISSLPDLCRIQRRLARFGLGMDALPDVPPDVDGANGHGVIPTCFPTSSMEELVENPPDRDQGDDFGRAVVIRGDLALVGAPGDRNARGDRTGAAYVLVRDLAGWRVEAKITAAASAAGDRFGSSVDLSGDLAIIGAPRADLRTARGTRNGAAFVFRRTMTATGPVWEQEGDPLTAFDGAGDDHFGFSVAINSRRGIAVVGSPRFGGIAREGAAYVFVRDFDSFGRTWRRQGFPGSVVRSRLQPTGGMRGDEHGYSVAISISGDTILVGAPSDDRLATDAGAAYIYTRLPRSTRFRFAASLQGAASREVMFGHSVALGRNLDATGEPELALVGAPGRTRSPGSAHVIQQPAAGWSGSALVGRRLFAPAGGGQERFGWSVDFSGNHFVISAPGTGPFADGSRGSVFLMAFQDPIFSVVREIRKQSPIRYGNYGDSVSVSAGVILVGASRDHATDSGGVFFYE